MNKTLNVVALDAGAFKSKYRNLANASLQTGFSEQMLAANHILKCCIDDCQITRFTGDMVLPTEKSFDGWAGALPEMTLVNSCLGFLNDLVLPNTNKDGLPWWIKYASPDATLIDPYSLKVFTEDVHSCKFYEILLSNIVTGESAHQFIELGQFLELSALNECGILSWRQK